MHKNGQKYVNSVKKVNRIPYYSKCYFFPKFFRKYPLLSSLLYLVNKRQFCENYSILRSKKGKRIPFFPIFQEKSLLNAHLSSEIFLFSKKHTEAHILLKNVHFLKKAVISCHFFSNFS